MDYSCFIILVTLFIQFSKHVISLGQYVAFKIQMIKIVLFNDLISPKKL